MKHLKFIIAHDEEGEEKYKNESGSESLRKAEEFVFYDDDGKMKDKNSIKYNIKTEIEAESMMSIKF